MSDCLIELGTEELPPVALKKLSEAFTLEFLKGLNDAALTYGEVTAYSTPRRLALLVQDCVKAQPDREMERRGPALAAAYDDQGLPTKAEVARLDEVHFEDCAKNADGFDQGAEQADPTRLALAENGMAGDLYFGTFDLGAEIVKGIKSGVIQWGIDQQPFLQAYLPVVVLTNYHRYGVLPGNNINSGPGFITKDALSMVEKFAGEYR